MAETAHIYLGADNKLSIRRHNAEYCPTGGQSLVRIVYSGINGADIIHGSLLGFNDNIAGYEGSGVMTVAGPDSPFSVGDLVAVVNYAGKGRPAYRAAHQDLVIAEPDQMSWKIPPHMRLADAAALTIMVRTAADALFNILEIPFLPLGFHCDDSFVPNAIEPILIWGGASTVGVAAIQLAKLAGLKPIIVTASPLNHEQLRKYGADYCLDYSDDKIVERIKTIVKTQGNPLRYIFDTVGIQSEGYSSPALCEECVTPSTSGTRFVCCVPVIGNSRWYMALASRNFPFPNPGVNGTTIMYEARPDWERRLIQSVLWAAQECGKTFFMPPLEIIKGAEAGVRAIEQSAAGKISFKKIVIEHPL